VLATVLAMAGRDRLKIKALSDARSRLREILSLLDDLGDE
jgi:hypothetical protein